MGVVVSFRGYTPAARFDAEPWTDAQVEEAVSSVGPWSVIDTLPLSPLDADPAQPAVRNLTTDNGSGDDLWYRLIYLDGNAASSEPTTPVRNVASPGDLYVSRAVLKNTLSLANPPTTYADDDIDASLAAASRGVDEACGRQFARDPSLSAVRFYRPQSATLCLIDDLVELVLFESDQNGDGQFERVWIEGSEFFLEPLNALADGYPQTKLVLNTFRGVAAFPYWSPRSIKLTARFGWPALPAQLVTATSLIASRLLVRRRQAPLGVVTAGLDVGAAVHIARNDPDVVGLLAPFVREKLT